jgi:uncharacterized metal-binding protein YceD (DUF177 family)
MDEDFELPVQHEGKELLFTSRLLHYGYLHRFEVEVNGQKVLFEPDEERNYRAMVDPLEVDRMKKKDIDLLQAIAEALQSLRG